MAANDVNATYRFEQDGKTWTLNLHDVLVSEQRELRQVTGMKWWPLLADFSMQDPEACHAMFWLARKRAGETVTFEDFDYPVTSLRVTLVEPDSGKTSTEDDGDSTEAPDPTQPTPKTSRTRRTK
ncbi:hypothetical protein [Prauserella muralis]|uniref:Uncharacterized protein n=1 Tax=Prauserella muralis TaxID=588067 RepID=A0A2V4ALE5_9PSEU|nr:hypothetical protein [Prauserella muralis]PXY21121.1 hypothetical protein BAY60_27020 [Prauserella muralis]TWE30208.1 hypothetical protein FHX69_2905 [Prauserella muralis]